MFAVAVQLLLAACGPAMRRTCRQGGRVTRVGWMHSAAVRHPAGGRAREGDCQDSERFPQVFEPLDLRQRLLDVRRAHDVTQVDLGLKSECALARRQLPHRAFDLLFGFLGQHRDDPPHVHAEHSNEQIRDLTQPYSTPDLA
ncbi:hypothetical protein ACFWUZ_33705 [Streptomyces sp. NPDC058646]|uniref:hypothetical protein n=1 Tax=Streptomyces sp. NPDC058646 TaxID=3346574 RepID=UPI003663BAD7